MKNVILCFSFLFLAFGLLAQAEASLTPAQQATEKLAKVYDLDAKQKAEMLKIQERKYRNLAEIEPLKATDSQLYLKKVRALQYANDKSFERILNQQQLETHRQHQLALREKKAQTYKELKTAGASQQEIDRKMMELDLDTLQ